jgi:hypothetical protein
MRKRSRAGGVLYISLPLLVSLAGAAEPVSDLYVGAAVTEDSDITVDGVVLPASILCGSECTTAKSAVGGIRVAYFFERLPWLGVAGDLSVFQASWGIQSPYEISAFPLSALLMLRAPLVRRDGYPNGRVQPYLAAGPSMYISTAELQTGWAFLGTARSSSGASVDAGADVRAGMRILGSDWISFLIEYRFTWASPSWTVDGRKVETDLLTNHFTLGLGIHY